LLLDVDPIPDDVDAGRIVDAGAEDTQNLDAVIDSAVLSDGSPDAIPTDGMVIDDGGIVYPDDCYGVRFFVPLGELDLSTIPARQAHRCGPLFWDAFGASSGTPSVQTASAGSEPVIVLDAAPDGTGAVLMLDFGSPVVEVSFHFEWLSFQSPMDIDERLGILVDGVPVAPVLSSPVQTTVVGMEVSSSSNKGDGHIFIGGAQTLSILLRNAGTGDGDGIELHSFQYTRPAP